VAVTIAAAVILFAVMLVLTATQTIAPGELLFEAVSALGTVGVSLGTTGKLDSVGRIIIIFAMFIGRIGPLTLFMLLQDRRPAKQPGYPQINIPLG
jgi:trk system potassium uptake protein TrkH